MDTPEFNDPALREALAYGRDAVEGRIAALNAVSADIKALEDYLSRSGVRVRLSVPMGNGEFLWWDRGEPDRWRIIYRYEDETDGDKATAVSVLTAKPLIETQSGVRLRARAFLPTLLRSVAAAAEVTPAP
jgi:hypothetical protein